MINMTKEEDEYGAFVIEKFDDFIKFCISNREKFGITENNARYIAIAVIANIFNPK